MYSQITTGAAESSQAVSKEAAFESPASLDRASLTDVEDGIHAEYTRAAHVCETGSVEDLIPFKLRIMVQAMVRLANCDAWAEEGCKA